MSVSDYRWVKLSKDILTDENFKYIQSQLAPELATAPYMFYLAALTLVDSDGIFDLEDGIIFQRLMQVGDIKDVFKIANLMQHRHIIARVSAKSNKSLIVDWDYGSTKGLTAAQRREKVQKMIDEEVKRKEAIKDFTPEDYAAEKPISFSEGNAPESSDFFCAENDKNSQNVVNEIENDKNQKSVVETEREKERVKTEKKETHTQKEADFRGHIECPLQSVEEKAAVAKKDEDKADDTQKESVSEASNSSDSLNKGDENSSSKISEEKENALFESVNDFFVKNCYGYKQNAARKAIGEIVKRCIELSNENNTPDIIASNLCREFKNLKETEYFQTMPLLPAYMIKPEIWPRITSAAGRYLLNNKNDQEHWINVQKQYEKNYLEERAAVCDVLEKEYLKYGIDPQDSNKFEKLQLAKKAEKQGETAEIDIF